MFVNYYKVGNTTKVYINVRYKNLIIYNYY